MTGNIAINSLRQMNYDICFFSVSGISDDGELSVISEEFGSLMRELWERSKRRVCLCDDSKFGKRAFYSVGDLRSVTHIISNMKFDSELIRKFDKTDFRTVDES